MDNSVIFKLLSSFYDFYKKRNDKSNMGENSQNFAENNTGGDFGGLPFLQNLIKKDTPSPEKKPKGAPTVKLAPLQNKMLDTMENHERIVKNVLRGKKS